MHICFQAVDFPQRGVSPGGVGTMTFTLGKALVARGHQVSIIAYNNFSSNTTTEMLAGMQVYRFHNHSLAKNYWTINQLIRSINRDNQIDIYDCTELNLAFIHKLNSMAHVIRMNGGHHFFAEAENRPTEWKKVWMEKRSFKKADHIIAVSNYVGKRTTELLRLKKPFTVINNPVDVSSFYAADPNKMIKNRLVFVGSIVEKKGIRQLVQALPKIKEVCPDVELLVVGRDANIPGTDKPYREILEREITPAIKQNITFTGAIPHSDVMNYIETAEVCVYPSHMEALPLAWLEALAMGKPFVGSKTGPGPEVVIDGKTGLLCDPHKPDDIAEKVIWMLQNKEAAQNMGLSARSDVIERFNIEKLVNENIEFYNSCLNA